MKNVEDHLLSGASSQSMKVGTSTIKADGDDVFSHSERVEQRAVEKSSPSMSSRNTLDVQTVGGCGVVAQAARLQAVFLLSKPSWSVIKDDKLGNPRTK